MQHPALTEALNLLECPSCRAGRPATGNGDGRLTCGACGLEYPFRNGYPDFCPDYSAKITPIQRLLQFRPMIAIYENIWRPLGYFLTSERSFPKDLKRVASWMEPERHRVVLDIGCGPGNFTRRIAESRKESIVVGCDLAREMLDRAVRLTPERPFPNVCYMRGDALSLPFRSGSFDAVVCFGTLQLLHNYEQALQEMSRVLRVGGDLLCQTVVEPLTLPLWLRMADRFMKCGYFPKEELIQRLNRLHFDIVAEERSKVSYIFRAAKSSLKT